MANTVIGASVQVEYSSVGEMRKALKEANSELLAMQEKFGVASQQAIEAAKKVADLKDRIQDAREASDLFDPGKKFQAFVEVGSKIAAGFSAVQGAMALVGSESEDLQKSLLKVQGAMSLAQGLSELKDFSGAWDKLKIFVGNATAGMSSFRKALLATGVGLFVAAIGTLVAYWDDLKDAISGANDITKAYGESQKEVTKAVSDARNKFMEVTTAIDLAKQGVISKEEALKKYNEKLGDTFGKTTSLEVAESRITKYTATYLKGIELRTRAQVFYGKAAEAAAKAASGEEVDPSIWQTVTDFFAAGGVNANFFAEQAKTTALNIKDLTDKQKQFTDEADRLTKEAIIAENELAALTKGNNEKEVKDNKEKNDKIIKDNQARLAAEKELNEFIKKENEKRIKNNQEDYVSELDIVRKIYDEKLALAKKYNLETKNLESLRLSAIVSALGEEERYRTNTINKNIDNFKVQAPKISQIDGKITANAANEAKIRTEISQAEAENRILITESFVNVLASLDSITGKNSEKSFERSKRLQIAQALINTYLSINKTLAAFAGVPIPGYAIAQAIATGIAGFVQVKKIAETKYQSPKINTTATIGGTASSVQSAAPLTPGLGATATAQALNAEAINNLGNTALRAYVMNSDIQNNSQRNAYLQRNARIG